MYLRNFKLLPSILQSPEKQEGAWKFDHVPRDKACMILRVVLIAYGIIAYTVWLPSIVKCLTIIFVKIVDVAGTLPL